MTRTCTKCDHEWGWHCQRYDGGHGCAGLSGWHDSDGCSCDGFSDDPRDSPWANADVRVNQSKRTVADRAIHDMWMAAIADMTWPSPIVSRVNRERGASE